MTVSDFSVMDERNEESIVLNAKLRSRSDAIRPTPFYFCSMIRF